jgi:hypothetical protein
MNQTEEIKVRCGCKLCSDNRAEQKRRKEIGFDDFPENAKNLILQLDDIIGNLMMDVDYAEAIIDGSWPNADEIIKNRREFTNDPDVESDKYHRWEMKIIDGGEEKWVPANRSSDGKYTPKIKNENGI